MIKLNIHLEVTKVSVPFTKHNAEKGVLRRILLPEIEFRFSAEQSGVIYITEYRLLVAVSISFG